MNIQLLKIDKSAEGKGLGSLLMNFAIAKAREFNCSQITLFPFADFNKDNPDPKRVQRLKSFYEHFGFVQQDKNMIFTLRKRKITKCSLL